MFKTIAKCRICGNQHLERVLDLGDQMLTGVFPSDVNAPVTVGPLRLVKCMGSEGVCGLVQLEHSFDAGEMYGDNYGYRSGLNASMVAHLHAKVARIQGLVALKAGDLIVDIGSNDGTTLKAYPRWLDLVGIDPTGEKFRAYYPPHVTLIPEFFSSNLVMDRFPGKKAKVVTSFSMFYDLESPMEFMREVYEILANDGIWIFEQSYLPTMLATNSYDTVCHEHIEFYSLKQIKWMADRIGFTIVDVEFNDVNGGSFSVTVRKSSAEDSTLPEVQRILDAERESGLDTLAPFRAFADRVSASRAELLGFLAAAKAEGKAIGALGASTKGNVLLQYCGLSSEQISFVGEVNPEKFGRYTPGTWIPIIPERDALERRPDFLIVLPWHFRAFFERSEKLQTENLVFPLPGLSLRLAVK